MKLGFSFFFLSLILNFNYGLSTNSSDNAHLRSMIESNYTKWKYEGSSSYEFVFEWSCYCERCYISEKLIRVGRNKMSTISYWNDDDSDDCNGNDLKTTQYKTINQLFEILINYTYSAASITVEFHSILSYPRKAFIDPSLRMADEEFGWQIDCLTVFSRSDIADYCDTDNHDSSFIWDYVGYALLGLAFIACMTISVFHHKTKNKQPESKTVVDNHNKRSKYAKMEEEQNEFNLDEQIDHQ